VGQYNFTTGVLVKRGKGKEYRKEDGLGVGQTGSQPSIDSVFENWIKKSSNDTRTWSRGGREEGGRGGEGPVPLVVDRGTKRSSVICAGITESLRRSKPKAGSRRGKKRARRVTMGGEGKGGCGARAEEVGHGEKKDNYGEVERPGRGGGGWKADEGNDD